MALTPELDRAARILEAVYIAATKAKFERRPEMWDPDAPKVTRRIIFADAYSPWVVRMSPWDYDRVYTSATRALTPVIADAARKWTLATLAQQALQVGKILYAVDNAPDRLTRAARTAVAAVPRVQERELTRDEYIEVTGQGRTRSGGTMVERYERVSLMRAVVEGGDWYLHKLMVHPRGVRLVKAFAKSPEDGKEEALEELADTEEAIRELSADIRDDEDLIWRYPIAITAGVAALGIRDRPALTGFALAWARWGEPDTANDALDVAGNVILALQLVGGPFGAFVGEVLDFALSIVGTAVALVRELEQDQAATATAFGPDGERLSEGGSPVRVALLGAAALAVAVAAPAVLSRLGRAATEGAERLSFPDAPPRISSAADDVRAVERRAVDDEPIPVRDRGLDDRQRGVSGQGIERIDGDGRKLAGARGSEDAVTGRPDAKVQEPPPQADVAEQRQVQQRGTGGTPPVTPPRPPRRRGTPGNASTSTPNTDTRTASGGITSVDRYISPDNETVVIIHGRIDPETIPESLYRGEWKRARPSNKKLAEYDSAHLFPLQWGDEAAEGFMYAHGAEFNRSIQKRLENYVRALRNDAPPGAELRVRVEGRSFPRHLEGSSIGNVLHQLKYEFEVVGTKTRVRIEFNVQPPPNGAITEIAAPFAVPD